MNFDKIFDCSDAKKSVFKRHFLKENVACRNSKNFEELLNTGLDLKIREMIEFTPFLLTVTHSNLRVQIQCSRYLMTSTDLTKHVCRWLFHQPTVGEKIAFFDPHLDESCFSGHDIWGKGLWIDTYKPRKCIWSTRMWSTRFEQAKNK